MITSVDSRRAAPQLRGREVLLVLGGCLGSMVLFGAGGVLLGAAFAGAAYALVVGIVLGTGGAWAGLWATLRRRHGWGWREMGFVRPRRSCWHLLWQVPSAMAASVVGATLLAAALGLTPEGVGSTERDLVGAAGAGPWLLVLLGLCMVLVLPAAEEVLFRRVLLDWSLTRTRAGLAVPLAAVVFALVHLAPVAMVYLVFLGVFTGLLRLWHDSLWAPLALHAVNNALVVLLAAQSL